MASANNLLYIINFKAPSILALREVLQMIFAAKGSNRKTLITIVPLFSETCTRFSVLALHLPSSVRPLLASDGEYALAPRAPSFLSQPFSPSVFLLF